MMPSSNKPMSARSEWPFSALNAARCRVYVQDLPQMEQAALAASSKQLSSLRHPTEWEHHQLSTELWILRALELHPWRVLRVEEADAIFVVTNRTRLCRAAYEEKHARRQHRKWIHSLRVWMTSMLRHGGSSQLKAVSVQDAVCPPPGKPHPNASKADGWPGDALVRTLMNGTLLLLEALHVGQLGGRAEFLRSPTPFVSKPEPAWLLPPTGTVPFSQHVPWATRKLLFFVSHISKLSISKLRYYIWRQLRRDPRATVASRTINCTVGSFSACRLPFEELRTKPRQFYWYHFCREACTRVWSGGKTHANSCIKPEYLSQPKEFERFLQHCHRNREFVMSTDWSDQLADMHTSALRAPQSRDNYLLTAAAHRFCIVVPGDFPSTPKITETILLGGAGGCIPVFVIPRDGSPGQLVRILPYTTWLDYCLIGFLVTENAARHRMGAVLDELARVSALQAAEKLARLRSVRHAFAFRTRMGSV